MKLLLWPCLFCLLLLALIGAGLLIYFLEFTGLDGPEPGELAWTLCGGSACIACDCYKRCAFGLTVGGHHQVELMHHTCAQFCSCALPAPVGQCGNGQRKNVEVDWYGKGVLFEEECDDGNAESGDGCSSACQIESYMMQLATGKRTTLSYEDGTRTLCGGNHSWGTCERSCLSSDSCNCVWFGGGICHHYSSCDEGQRTDTTDDLEISWGEVEYRCGTSEPNAFLPDNDVVDIRAAIILFGSDMLTPNEQLRFRFSLRDTLLDPCDPCTTTIVAMEPGTLPSTAATDFRRAAVSGELELSGRRTAHDGDAIAGGRRDDHSTNVSMTTTPSPESLRLKVLVVEFKVSTLNTTAPDVLTELQSFVDAGDQGLLGELKKETFFPDLRGLIFSPGQGEPRIQLRPAPPSELGTLFRKKPFSCEPDRYPPFGEQKPTGDVPYLCCGNVTGVCSPPLRCYVSSMRAYDCVAAQPPYPPTVVIGVPLDSQASVSWQAPEDHGGFEILAYRIEKVQFVLNGTGYEVAVPRTRTNATSSRVAGLENFRPYYLRVLAINRIGTGRPSLPSPPLTPSVHAPRAPLNGMGEVGNHRVWLKWDPVIWDGGRELLGYILEMKNTTGWFRMPLTANRVITNVPPLSGQYSVMAFDPALIRPSRRLLQTGARNCSYLGGECDPLSPMFMVVGDLSGNRLVNFVEYQFRLFSGHSFSRSRASDVIAIVPAGEPPKIVQNFTAICHDTVNPTECTQGTGGFREIDIQFQPPLDDSGSPVLGYVIAISSDSGRTFTDVLPQSYSDISTFGYTITNLTNGVAYHVRVAARNARGNGSRLLIGPITPRQCLHMEQCAVCIEPYYEVWGNQCQAPLCYNVGPPQNTRTRLRDCTPDGCRYQEMLCIGWTLLRWVVFFLHLRCGADML